MIPNLRAFIRSENKVIDISNIDFLAKEIEYVNGDFFTSYSFSEIDFIESVGIYDIEDKEIYTGDIVQHEEGELSFTAVVVKAYGKWIMEDINYDEVYLFDDILDQDKADVKVVGNTYEQREKLSEFINIRKTSEYYLILKEGSYLRDLDVGHNVQHGSFWATYTPTDEATIDNVWKTKQKDFAVGLAIAINGRLVVKDIFELKGVKRND